MKKILFVLMLLVLTSCGRVEKVETAKIPLSEQLPRFFNFSVMQNIEWNESPVFTYDQIKLRGVKRQVAILATPWRANKPNKYMVYLFGNDIHSGNVSVIAVKKGTSESMNANNLDDYTQTWSLGFVPVVVDGHVELPATFKLPSKGMWVLNVYFKEKLHGQIIVNVK